MMRLLMLGLTPISCLVLSCVLSISSGIVAAEKSLIPLEKAPTDITDQASLQRGAQLYINNCLGCHGIKYERYNGLAKGIGITDEAGNVLEAVVKENLLFVGDKITDPIDTAMQVADAEKWFGMAPPDLSLVARVRGKDWLYTYLKSFYRDPERPWGVNNLVFPDVAMPHVLLSLQGIQEPRYVKPGVAMPSTAAVAGVTTMPEAAVAGVTVPPATAVPEFMAQSAVVVAEQTQVELQPQKIAGQSKTIDSGHDRIIESLELAVPGTMTPVEYDHAITDLVNFLSYVAEPVQVKRQNIGVLVLVFLGIFLVFSYLLKREYWKNVH